MESSLAQLESEITTGLATMKTEQPLQSEQLEGYQPGLTRFRPDLDVRQVTRQGDQGPSISYVILDRTTGERFELQEEEYFLCQAMDGVSKPKAIIAAFEREFDLTLSPQGFEAFSQQVAGYGLLEVIVTPYAEYFPGIRQRLSDDEITADIFIAWRLINPESYIQTVANFFWSIRYLFWVLFAFMLFLGGNTYFNNTTLFWDDFYTSVAPVSLVIKLAINTVAINLMTRVVQAIVCVSHGGPVPEVGLRLMLFFFPRFYINKRGLWILNRKGKLWAFSSTIWSRLLLVFFSVVFWKLTRTTDNQLSTGALILSFMGIVSMFFVGNPFLPFPTDGYVWLTTLFNIDKGLINQTLLFWKLLLTFQPIPPTMTWDRRLFCFIHGLMMAVSISLLFVFLISIVVGLEKSYGGTGVAIILIPALILGSTLIGPEVVKQMNRRRRPLADRDRDGALNHDQASNPDENNDQAQDLLSDDPPNGQASNRPANGQDRQDRGGPLAKPDRTSRQLTKPDKGNRQLAERDKTRQSLKRREDSEQVVDVSPRRKESAQLGRGAPPKYPFRRSYPWYHVNWFRVAFISGFAVILSLPYDYTVGGPVQLSAPTTANIEVQVSGEVLSVNYPGGDGQLISEGSVIAVLGAPDLDVSLANTEEELRKAQAVVARQEALLDLLLAGPKPEAVAVSQEQLLLAEQNVRFAESQLESASNAAEFSARRLERSQELYDEGAISLQAVERIEEEVESDQSLIRTREDALQTAEQNLETARAQLRLAESGARTQEVRAAEQQLEVDRLEVARIQKELDFFRSQSRRTELLMPFDGYLSSSGLTQKVGNFLARGEVFAVAQVKDDIQAIVEIPQSELDVLSDSGKVRLRFYTYPGQRFDGEIISETFNALPSREAVAEDVDTGQVATPVAPATSNRVVRISVEITNPGNYELRPGLTGYAKMEGTRMPVLLAFTRPLVRFFQVEVWSWLP